VNVWIWVKPLALWSNQLPYVRFSPLTLPVLGLFISSMWRMPFYMALLQKHYMLANHLDLLILFSLIECAVPTSPFTVSNKHPERGFSGLLHTSPPWNFSDPSQTIHCLSIIVVLIWHIFSCMWMALFW
jgi:hypothetical protein